MSTASAKTLWEKVIFLLTEAFFLIYFFINHFFFVVFSHTTQHSIQNKTKQNKQNKTKQNKTKQQTLYSTFQGPIKREREREGQSEHKKSLLYTITYIHQKKSQASMVECLAPPTHAVVHSHVTICRRLRIQYVFLHMCDHD